MDLMKNIDRKISSLYKGESTEKLMTISAMIKTLLGLCVLAGFLAIIVKSSGFERYILIGLFAAFSLMLLASFRGAARQTSVVLTIVVSLALLAMPLSHPYEGFLELYMEATFVLFGLGLALFVGYYAWQSICVAAIGTVGLLIMLFLRVIPAARAAGAVAQIDDAVIAIVLCWLVTFFVYRSRKNSSAFITQAVDESEKNLRQLSVLQDAMGASKESLALGEKLSASARETSGVVEKTLSIVDRAERSMDGLTQDSATLKDELSAISSSSTQARSSAESQSSVVNQTSAAVEEMTASIKSITTVTQERKQAVKNLAAGTEDGQRVVALSSQSMQSVKASATAILDIVGVINSVASQTNLLAMNAAIEAAHAGEFGRGFSVVADEIRKLSEQTGKNVKAVSETVKGTIADINKAAENNERAVASFNRISDEAKLVSDAMDEIIRGLEELSVGTGEINEGVANSVTSTNELRGAVGSVDEKLAAATKSLATLGDAAREVLQELASIKQYVGNIASEARNVREIGEVNEAGLARLQEELNKAHA
jgi:methyl-accepting chemotaxis protein